MSKAPVLNLIKSLRLRNHRRGEGSRGLQAAIELCCKELFGLSHQEFTKRWRPRVASDKGTLRGYMQPTAEALFEEWKQRRDPDWLYSHPEYMWDSLGVSVCQTHATTAGGISLLKNANIYPKRIFDWGAGPGFSTFMLAANFRRAIVHYNECNADLIRIFEWFKKNTGIRNVEFVKEPQGNYDLIQAYEIVEHIGHPTRKGVGDPITETMKILQHSTPQGHFLHSSCWSAENRYFTLGHFLQYQIDGTTWPNTRVGSAFRRAMAKRGWKEMGAGWNSRPFLFGRV